MKAIKKLSMIKSYGNNFPICLSFLHSKIECESYSYLNLSDVADANLSAIENTDLLLQLIVTSAAAGGATACRHFRPSITTDIYTPIVRISRLTLKDDR